MFGRVCKLFARPRTKTDAISRVATDADCRTLTRPEGRQLRVVHVLNDRLFSVSILESTNSSIGLICITRNITHFFRTKVFSSMTEQSTLLTLLHGKTRFLSSAADANGTCGRERTWTPRYRRPHSTRLNIIVDLYI